MGNKTVTPVAPVTYVDPVPQQATSTKSPDDSTTQLKSPNAPTVYDSSNEVVPIPPAKTFDISTTKTFALHQPNAGVTTVSPKPAAPVTTSIPTDQVTSPKRVVPAASPRALSVNDTLDKSSNFYLPPSRDSSTIIPIFNSPSSPINAISVNSIGSSTPPTKNSPDIPITNNPPQFTEVVPQRRVSIARKLPSRQTPRPPKPIDSFSTEKDKRANEEKPILKRHSFNLPKTAPKPSIFTSVWTDSAEEQTNIFALNNIVPVPSYTLRATAVCRPDEEEQLLARTPSIHSNISIFKFYLDQNEAHTSNASHRKATMFKMDTVHKRTPFPQPTLSSFLKNFNDGTEESEVNTSIPPTFQSLGLHNDLEIGETNKSKYRDSSSEKRRRDVRALENVLFSEANSINSNAFRYTPPKMNDHPTLLTLENTSTQKSHQPITSILKKPSNQKYKDLSSTKNSSKVDINRYSPISGVHNRSITGNENSRAKRPFFRKN